MGDFNINLISAQNNNHASKLIDLFHSSNMYSLINKPTRVTDTTATLIDHIWSNDYNNCIKNGIVFDDILSDHFPIFAVFNHLEQVNNDNRKKEIMQNLHSFLAA